MERNRYREREERVQQCGYLPCKGHTERRRDIYLYRQSLSFCPPLFE
jgi:hypothetical protein